jgi:flagellar basal body-associated protein FliL
MKKRSLWMIGGIIVVVLLIVAAAGIVYAQRFSNTVAASQQHKAAGAIQVTPTPVATTAQGTLQTFKIVPAQTTASYSVYENLIFQNKPNNDAIGTTHSVSGNFQIRSGATPAC